MDTALMALCLVPLIFAAVTDMKKRIIPDWTWISMLMIGMASAVIAETPIITLTDRLVGLVLAASILLLIAIKTDGLGGGDIKLIAAMGFNFGLIGVAVILAFSTIIVCIYSCITKQKCVPLAVFLCSGFLIYFAITIIFAFVP